MFSNRGFSAEKKHEPTHRHAVYASQHILLIAWQTQNENLRNTNVESSWSAENYGFGSLVSGNIIA